MRIKPKFMIVLVLLSAIAMICGGAINSQREYKNLKVLPKYIGHEELGQVMGKWSHALGVRCNFCHVRNDATRGWDYVSDAKPEKNMARQMLLMTERINKKYFKAGKDSLGMINEVAVSCITCHRGSAKPEK